AEGNASDITGQNNGTLVNGAGFSVGEVGQAFAFNGVNQFVRVPDAAPLDPTDELTVEAWVYVTAYPAGDIVTIVGKEDPNGVHQYQLTLWYAQGRWCFRPTIVAGGVAAYFPGQTAVQTGQWYHIATTYDGSTVRLYVNGQLDGSVAATGPIATSTQPLRIGGDETGWFFNGLVDEASVYGHALSGLEIQGIYNAGSGGKCSGTTAPEIYAQPLGQSLVVGKTVTFDVLAVGTQPLSYQWSFNGDPLAGATSTSLTITNVQFGQAGAYSVTVSNTVGFLESSNAILTVNPPPPCSSAQTGMVSWWQAEGDAGDSIGANSGTLVNGPGFASGYVGEAFRFTGANQIIQVADAPSLNPTNAITLETWVMVTTNPATDAAVIFGKDGQTSGRQYELDAYRSGGQLVFLANIGIPEGFVGLTGTNRVDLNTWNHVAMTYDGAYLRLYVNGRLDSSRAATGPISGGTAPFRIGGLGSGPWSFNGLVDEVSLYNRALDADEISAIYGADASGKCPVLVAPVIATQPASQTVTLGQDVTFTVLAGGARPLSYQWALDGAPMMGATSASLVLTNVQRSQAGAYSVEVTNEFGTVISSNA
ncbi:MAG: LamG-like jellyroll fold domain-containing protein, partial [Limisphaerales bacterium]